MSPGLIRGPLRYKIETSSPQIEAGRDFSVSITITNPYDVPAVLRAVTTRLPAKFIDIAALSKEQEIKKRQWELKETTRRLLAQRFPEIKASKEESRTSPNDPVASLLKIAGLLVPGVGPAMIAGNAVAKLITASPSYPDPESIADILKPEEIDSAIERLEHSQDRAKTFNEIILENLRIHLQRKEGAAQPDISLQPGNSSVQTFTLRTTQAVFFTPSTYNLHMQMEYMIGGALNQDAVEYQLSVRAPLKALIWGSTLGSIMGHSLRDIWEGRGLSLLIQQPSPAGLVTWLLALFGSILLGILLVIAFARKKDTQPLISVEDFWGGVFIGFLAGYQGRSLLDQVVKPALQSPTPSNPKP